jgi:hypothetical protein
MHTGNSCGSGIIACPGFTLAMFRMPAASLPYTATTININTTIIFPFILFIFSSQNRGDLLTHELFMSYY